MVTSTPRSPAQFEELLKTELLKSGAVWFGAERRARAAPSVAAVSFGVESIDAVLPCGGLAPGTLHEWFLDAPFSEKKNKKKFLPPATILALLAAHAIKRSGFAVWVGKDSWPSPYLLQQLRCDLSRCLFVEVPDRMLLLWAVETALRSPAVSAVVANCASLRFAASRRLALAASKGGGVALLSRPLADAAQPSAAASKWLVKSTPTERLLPRWKLTLLKSKGPQSAKTSWTVEFGTVEFGSGALQAVQQAEHEFTNEERKQRAG